MTYDLIQEQVLGSAAASVTFSNIPQGFKDLVLEVVARSDFSSGGPGVDMRINGDSGTNYSWTQLVGDGSTASSGRVSSATSVNMINFPSAGNGSALGVGIIHFQSYANTSVNKALLARSDSATNWAIARVGLWRSTAAISTILLTMGASSNFVSGSTFRLYGIAG